MEALLINELQLFDKSLELFIESYNICRTIPINSTNRLQLQQLDAFSSRFSRTSDILIQKLFRTIVEIEGENADTVRDKINLMNKIGVIQDNTELLADIRRVRNKIAHEYLEIDHNLFYQKLLEYSSSLILFSQQTIEYCRLKYNITK